MGAARDVFFGNRLLIPMDLADRCEAFFKKLFEGQSQFDLALDPGVENSLQREATWGSAVRIAFDEVPALLKDIESEARLVVHGGSLTQRI
jgi:hypothetical protein